jgi:hypothetical protein
MPENKKPGDFYGIDIIGLAGLSCIHKMNLKPTLIIVLVIVAGAMAGFLFLRSRIAESGTLAELPRRLAKLKLQDSDPKAFLGFCTCDEDAIYFVHADGGFYLDYELTTPAKKGHADAFRKAAADLGFPVIDTTYGEFPVLRVKTGDSEAQAAKVGLEYSQRLFGHDEKTVYEFLP